MDVILTQSFHLQNSANDRVRAAEHLLGPADFQATNGGFTQDTHLMIGRHGERKGEEGTASAFDKRSKGIQEGHPLQPTQLLHAHILLNAIPPSMISV